MARLLQGARSVPFFFLASDHFSGPQQGDPRASSSFRLGVRFSWIHFCCTSLSKRGHASASLFTKFRGCVWTRDQRHDQTESAIKNDPRAYLQFTAQNEALWSRAARRDSSLYIYIIYNMNVLFIQIYLLIELPVARFRTWPLWGVIPSTRVFCGCFAGALHIRVPEE